MKRAPSCNSLSPRLKSCGRPPVRQRLRIKAGMEAVGQWRCTQLPVVKWIFRLPWYQLS